MAGTEIIWQCQFYDYNGETIVVNIKQDGYAGSTVIVDGGPVPCLLKMMSEGDGKFTHFKTTECILELVSSTSLQYLNLFLSPVKTYFVEIYKGIYCLWTGWINPDNYSEPFIPPPYITTVHCTDGIAELKNIELPLPGTTTADFKQTVIYYICKCLKQIETPHITYVNMAVNLSATTTADGIVTSRLFEKLFIDYRTFTEDDGTFWNCYDVLNEILSSLNARIYKWGECWNVERLDQKHASYPVETYDSDGAYLSTSSFDPVTALTAHVGKGTDIRFINDPAMLEVQPAYKGYKIEQDYGNRINLIQGTSYNLFTDHDWIDDTHLRFWALNGNIDIVHEKNLGAVRIKGIYTSGTDFLLSEKIKIEQEGVDSITNLVAAWTRGDISLIFTFDVAKRYAVVSNNQIANLVLGADFSGNDYRAENVASDKVTRHPTKENAEAVVTWLFTGMSLTKNTLKKIFKHNNNTPYVSNPDSTGWLQPAVDLNFITVTFKNDAQETATNDWITTTMEFASPPDAEIGVPQTRLWFQIYMYKCATNNNPGDVVDTDGVMYRNMRLYFKTNNPVPSIDDGSIKPDEYRRTVDATIDVNNILDPESYEIRFGDTPHPYPSDGWGLINRYVFFDSTGKAVNEFGQTVEPPPYPLPNYSLIRQVIDNDLNLTYRRPLFKLRGNIIDTVGSIDFRTCLKDYNDRYYIITGMAYDLKASTFGGEWLQNHDESGLGEFNDDFSDDFFT